MRYLLDKIITVLANSIFLGSDLSNLISFMPELSHFGTFQKHAVRFSTLRRELSLSDDILLKLTIN